MVEDRIISLEQRIARLESSLDKANTRLNHLENRLNRVENGLAELRREMTTNFRWIMGTIILMWVTIMGTLAGLFSVLLTRFSP